MKKLYLCAICLLSIMLLSSCQRQQKYTVTNVALTEDEAQIAHLTSDMVSKFIFEKDKSYDISVYVYKQGKRELINELSRIDIKDKDGFVLISGEGDGNANYSFNISSQGGTLKGSTYVIDDDEITQSTKGIGQEKFVMEVGKEYALYYVAFKKGNGFDMSLVAPFLEWDKIENKEEISTELDYVYLVTTNISTD